MHNTLLKRLLGSFSDNLKSKIQNRKWLGLSLIAFVLVECGAAALAQEPKKVPRIGYLSAFDPATESTRFEAIRRSLRDLGYIEQQNIAFEYRSSERRRDLPELAAELVRLKVDIIVVAGGETWVRAARVRVGSNPELDSWRYLCVHSSSCRMSRRRPIYSAPDLTGFVIL
jgi:hypothetical protein